VEPQKPQVEPADDQLLSNIGKDKEWQRTVPSYDNRTSYSNHRGIENIEEVMILFGCFFLYGFKTQYKTPFLKLCSGQKNDQHF
jgi:hypothetical protein